MWFRHNIVTLAMAFMPGIALAQAPVQFQCPRQGVIAEYSDGGRTVWGGADPADPTICLVRAGNTDRRLLYAFWRLPFSHNGAEASARAGLSQLYPATAGKSVSYDLFLPRANQTGDNPYRETWKIVRFESVSVRAGTFNAMVIERVQDGRGGSVFQGTWTRWIDLNSRVPVKQTFALSRGRPSGTQEWEAMSVQVPPAPAAQPAPAAPAPAQRPRG
jgi:hypothetical protein